MSPRLKEWLRGGGVVSYFKMPDIVSYPSSIRELRNIKANARLGGPRL